MVKGQKVYTINAKTNNVDEWIYNGYLPAEKELLVHLSSGKEYCFLPARCVFSDKSEALAVARK